MRNRRASFGKNIVPQAINQYSLALQADTHDMLELQWAHDVLQEYFKAVEVDSHPNIAKAKQRFDGLKKNSSTGEKKPYASKRREQTDISYEAFMKLAMQRRSVRWFEEKPVEREKIDQALLAGRQSPSACNRLPYEIRFFDDADMVKKVAGLPFGAAGYADNIPTIAVVIGKLDSYFSSRDRHAMYIDASLATMAFIFALETLGLSSSVINWPDFEPLELKMQKLLGLDVSERVIMLVAIGYADPEGMIPYSQKKQLDTIRNFNVLAE